MDLVGRKLGQGGGANLQAFAADVGRFVAAHGEHKTLGPEIKRLGSAHDALTRSAMKLLGWFGAGQIDMIPLAANRFLEMMAESAGRLASLLEGAVVADEKRGPLDKSHLDQVLRRQQQAALFFARNILPGVEWKAQPIDAADRSAIDMPDAGFASVQPAATSTFLNVDLDVAILRSACPIQRPPREVHPWSPACLRRRRRRRRCRS